MLRRGALQSLESKEQRTESKRQKTKDSTRNGDLIALRLSAL
jgi:hypothetical protein